MADNPTALISSSPSAGGPMCSAESHHPAADTRTSAEQLMQVLEGLRPDDKAPLDECTSPKAMFLEA